MRFSVSAPGKIILTGEHAVVYGYKGIATSINLKCYANVDENANSGNCVNLYLKSIPFMFKLSEKEYFELKDKTKRYNDSEPSRAYQSVINDFLDNKISENTTDIDFIRSGLVIFLDLYLQTMSKFISCSIHVSSEFSYGCGLGSSAAYSTVISTSLLIISRKINPIPSNNNITSLNLNQINNLALRGETIVHDTPSGIDNCVSLNGKCVVFQKRESEVSIEIKNIPNLKIILADTGVKRCTRSVLKAVRKIVMENPAKYNAKFKEIHNITEQMENLLTNKPDFKSMNELVFRNQEILRELGVSHPSIESALEVLAQNGIVGKLTGAGWGGCVYGLVSDDTPVNKVIMQLEMRGYKAWEVNVSCEGVQIINCDDSL